MKMSFKASPIVTGFQRLLNRETPEKPELLRPHVSSNRPDPRQCRMNIDDGSNLETDGCGPKQKCGLE
jgi:hypothetical protein